MPSLLIQGKMIDSVLAQLRPGNPLVGQGPVFAKAGEERDVDWRLLVAIAYAETELGVTGNAERIHNPFGLGPGISFNSWALAIMRAAELIQEYRDNYGLTTVAEIGSRWAPQGAANDPSNLNSNWTRNVTATLTRLGGNPSDVTAPGGGGISSIPGDLADVVSGAADAVSSPVEFLRDLVARLIDPAWWIRVGMVIAGVLALGLGVVLIGRSVTDTAQAEG